MSQAAALPPLFDRRNWITLGGPVVIVMVLAMMVLPLPPFLLDVLFTFNIAISILVLLVAVNTRKPLEFAVFPTILLLTTLLRLSLNIASTRVVLLEGHTGPGAAGKVIEAFGHFLVGGNYAVGLTVFIIMVVINFVVITKGAGRIAEVSARFTLDAMPGKQMAIDADLNAGLLTPEEAKIRRQEVATEADFYGSMDGASKFVKGDAVAGVLILVINILGGLILGVMSHGLSLSEAASTYIILAIGDALVAQVPALLLSIAAAAIVTRVSSPLDLSGQIISQFGSARAWAPVSGILALLGVVPGMPHFIILSASGVAGFLAWKLSKARKVQTALDVAAAEAAAVPAPLSPNSIDWNEISDGAALGLELGYGLVGLVDDRKGAPLMARITGIRRQLSRELGFVIPLVRVRDNLSLPPNAYRITVAGVIMGEDEAHPDQLLALDSGDLEGTVEGRACRDPSFGLEAVWIHPDRRGDAIVAGYTVVDPATVVATHLNQVIAAAAADLFGMDEAQRLLEALKEAAPQLVAGLTPAPLSLAQIAAACRALLAEGVPLRDFRRIAEAMVDAAGQSSDAPALVENIRSRIGALIVQTLVPVKMPLPVVTLDAGLESLLAQAVRTSPGAAHPFEPALANRIVSAISEAAAPLVNSATRFAIVTSPIARRALARLLKPHLPETPVMSFLEIPDGKAVEVAAVVGGGPAHNANAGAIGARPMETAE